MTHILAAIRPKPDVETRRMLFFVRLPAVLLFVLLGFFLYWEARLAGGIAMTIGIFLFLLDVFALRPARKRAGVMELATT